MQRRSGGKGRVNTILGMRPGDGMGVRQCRGLGMRPGEGLGMRLDHACLAVNLTQFEYRIEL